MGQRTHESGACWADRRTKRYEGQAAPPMGIFSNLRKQADDNGGIPDVDAWLNEEHDEGLDAAMADTPPPPPTPQMEDRRAPIAEVPASLAPSADVADSDDASGGLWNLPDVDEAELPASDAANALTQPTTGLPSISEIAQNIPPAGSAMSAVQQLQEMPGAAHHDMNPPPAADANDVRWDMDVVKYEPEVPAALQPTTDVETPKIPMPIIPPAGMGIDGPEIDVPASLTPEVPSALADVPVGMPMPTIPPVEPSFSAPDMSATAETPAFGDAPAFGAAPSADPDVAPAWAVAATDQDQAVPSIDDMSDHVDVPDVDRDLFPDVPDVPAIPVADRFEATPAVPTAIDQAEELASPAELLPEADDLNVGLHEDLALEENTQVAPADLMTDDATDVSVIDDATTTEAAATEAPSGDAQPTEEDAGFSLSNFFGRKKSKTNEADGFADLFEPVDDDPFGDNVGLAVTDAPVEIDAATAADVVNEGQADVIADVEAHASMPDIDAPVIEVPTGEMPTVAAWGAPAAPAEPTLAEHALVDPDVTLIDPLTESVVADPEMAEAAFAVDLDAPAFETTELDAPAFDTPAAATATVEAPSTDSLPMPQGPVAAEMLEILGLGPDATWDEAREARRTLVAEHNPDHAEDKERADLAKAICREMNRAYAGLRLLQVP